MKDDPSLSPNPEAKKVNRILVVDDHPVIRYGITALLEKQPDMEVCGEAGNAAIALDLTQRLKPDAAVIDISLPGTDGIELLRLMKRSVPKTRVLVLSMQEECDFGPKALRAGASGYLMKDDAVAELVPALRQVLCDGLHMSEQLKRHILASEERASESRSGGSADKVDTSSGTGGREQAESQIPAVSKSPRSSS